MPLDDLAAAILHHRPLVIPVRLPQLLPTAALVAEHQNGMNWLQLAIEARRSDLLPALLAAGVKPWGDGKGWSGPLMALRHKELVYLAALAQGGFDWASDWELYPQQGPIEFAHALGWTAGVEWLQDHLARKRAEGRQGALQETWKAIEEVSSGPLRF